MTHAERIPKSSRTASGLKWPQIVLGVFFMFAGVMHFVVPATYASIVPPWIPNAMLMVYISGVAEFAGGLGVLLPLTRRLAGWGLIVLLVAIFPANIQMLLAAYAGHATTAWKLGLWGRLPLQPLMIWWVWRVAARPQR